MIKQTKIITSTVFMCLWLFQVPGYAATFEVDCNNGETIQAVLDGDVTIKLTDKPSDKSSKEVAFNSGDTILVNGLCLENIDIPSKYQNVTIDGQGSTTISANSGRAVNVAGNYIRLQNLAVQNGGSAFEGIRIISGLGIIENVSVSGFTGNGLRISYNGSA